jgi:pimeloyl-ACP methyl ester carboxylesterase
MNTEQFPFVIPGVNGRQFHGDVFSSSSESGQPVIVFCHGFKGFKDWGFFPYLGRRFAQFGYCSVLFNFSHNGIGDEPEVLTELDRFRENCFAFEREDLRLLLRALRRGALPVAGRMNTEQIVVAGHSRGGAAALSAAHEAGVRAIALLASVSRYPEVPPAERERWIADAVIYVENSRTKQQLPLGAALREEVLGDPTRIERDARGCRLPVCIIHGDADTSVPVSSASLLASWCEDQECHILAGVDHVFGSGHPFAGPTAALEEVIRLLQTFFERRILSKTTSKT